MSDPETDAYVCDIALRAVEPALQGLAAQNNDLQQRLAREQKHRLDQQLEQAGIDFRSIDRDPRWHQWLMTPDPLTGRSRQLLLNDAVAQGNISRVKAFFEGFQREAGGNPPQQQHRSRSPAPASGKQIYTRELIGKLYEAHRKGAYTEAEWIRIEKDIFESQRDGRFQDSPYLTR